MKYYVITWNLDVIPLGECSDFDDSDSKGEQVAAKMNEEVMYIANQESIDKLKEELKKL